MTRSPADMAQHLGAAVSDVAADLYNLENAPDMVFVRTQADGGNAAATAVMASLGLAWERYALLKDAVDRLETAVAARRAPEIDALLGPTAVPLPDGTTLGIAQLADDIRLRVQQIEPRLTTLAGAARQAVAKLDAAQAATSDLVARAAAVGAADDVEITALRAALDQAFTAVSRDPAQGTDLAALDRAVADARHRVDALEQQHRTVPAALTAATAQLTEIETLVERATAALALTRAKMAPSAGLVQPPDLGATGDRSLRGWLDRLQAQADAGELEAAAAGLTRRKAAATATPVEAHGAEAANGAPLARRNELRGLLDAYRAKAAALGRDEDGRLARLHAAARGVLYTAPCQLDAAEARVREYVSAVNDKQPDKQPDDMRQGGSPR
ncbi:MAG: hypothetical protein ACR2KK_05610 [Acidimicrobiales bacterium]